MLLLGYNCVRRLGEGTFGEAYLIDHDGGQAVLKVLKDPSNPRICERFKREARMLERHSGNAHVLKIMVNATETAQPHIIVEYCDGGSLDAWFKRPELPSWEGVAMVLAHIAMSLEAIHASPGFHRDIKPANILIGTVMVFGAPIRVAKLGDFGLARENNPGSATMTANGVGTPAFMPPEVIRNGPWTPAGDVYSLGMTGIQLLTRSLDPAAAQKIDGPAWFKRLLAAMTDGDRTKRPTVQQVQDTIRTNMNPPKDDPPKRPSPTPPPEGGPSWGWLAAVAGALAAAAIAADNANTTDAQGRTRRPNGQYGKGWFG